MARPALDAPAMETDSAVDRGAGANAPSGGAGTNDLRFRSQFRKTELCAFFTKGWCSKGERCEFAHGVHEIQAVPDLTKTSLCRKWLKWSCNRSSVQCPFAHGAHELRVTEAYAQKPLPGSNRSPHKSARGQGRAGGPRVQGQPAEVSLPNMMPAQVHPFPEESPAFIDDSALVQKLLQQQRQHPIDPRLWAAYASPYADQFPYAHAFVNLPGIHKQMPLRVGEVQSGLYESLARSMYQEESLLEEPPTAAALRDFLGQAMPASPLPASMPMSLPAPL